MTGCSRDSAALARKDLLLELRARETLPAMLLFVVTALVVFHFALPADVSERAAGGLLWVAIVFTALLGLTRAFVAEREQGLLDALVLSPCDRAAIWVGKALAVFAFLLAAEVVALPAYALFFTEPRRRRRRRRAAREHRHLRGRHARRRDGRRRAGSRAALAAALPAARDPDRRRRRRGDRGRRSGAAASAFSRCTTPSLRSCASRALSTWSRNNAAAALSSAAASLVLLGLGLALLWAPEDADQGISQKIFYVHVPSR